VRSRRPSPPARTTTTRCSDVANVISERLSSVDPANRADYQKNAKAFEAKLATLSEESAGKDR
jgi:ABC-type Zn uptake system ZnuABC Zn-binding protein ZnuA